MHINIILGNQGGDYGFTFGDAADGSLTQKSHQALETLMPILKLRLQKLKVDDGSNEQSLRNGLSSGPFDKKFTIGPVAK